MVSTLIQTSGISTPVIPATTNGGSMTIVFIAVGAIVSLLLIVIIIVIIIVVVLKKERFKKDYDIVSSKNKPVTAEQNLTPYIERIQEATYSTVMEPIPPVIEEFPNDVTSEEGCQVHFKVKFKGTPTPFFNWYHNGEPVTDDYAHELRGDGSLLLVSVEEKHKGTYRFVANNEAGTVSQQVVLTVAVEEARIPSNDTSTAKGGKNLVPVGQFGEFVANGHAKGNEGFRNQFMMLDSGESDHTATVGLTPSNKLLNRFANIVVYDDNRIILRPISGHKDCPNGYINACYVDGYSDEYQYIATQGPVSKTVVDFWCLVWQERPPVIVMVTNVKEEGKVKCQQYWPDSDTKDYGPFSVTLSDEQVLTEYIIRKIHLTLLGSDQPPLMITQYHFTSWPDHGVPEYATSILQFHRRIKNEYKPTKGPMLVHCSAGVGRTGTFMA
ncbi:PREDICTED: receptor-type tyrosine-protein phosphatase alpha-like, partial [Amphimedon queenslandica]|uniref:Protein-tyrosine-phosphatase n=1 Tax=Amphimedon queenslandica TaxID=400682 RepID=A0AAN0JFH8_AMPQE